ncbi:RAD55 family ATPase [Halopiger goleimassiliensis]|uniref:RAD55 family ATPase n=1 Tax=Halopiger goleimassiliensis TaxID=1293048 RepID=UPI000677F184|nr:ATPase domain-containing protein [Halopiger goleimassiliensis]
MTESARPNRSTAQPLECDYCHYPIPGDPEESDDGQFCSTACLEAAEDDETLPDPGAYKRIGTGIEPLDSLVPDGIPADSFLLVSGDEGTRRDELLTELVWRALERGEPAVLVCYANPPIAALERFFENGWNVLPALESDRLRVLDCFTHRLADRDQYLERRAEWATFLGEAAADAIVEVSEPSDVRAVANSLHGALEDVEMSETGLVTIDSLDELSALVQDELVHNFIKDVRATVCKASYVPIVAGATTAGETSYPGDEYVFDGIVDLRLQDWNSPSARYPQLGIRKLIGARYLPQWVTYEYEPVRGLYAVERSEDRRRPPRNPQAVDHGR